MVSKFCRSVAVAGAASLLSAQAVYAAPAPAAPSVDPLVAVSVLAHSQSRAAVCGTGAACTAALTSAASPALAASSAATAQQDLRQRRSDRGLLMLAMIGGLMLAIVAAAVLLGGDNDPASPE